MRPGLPKLLLESRLCSNIHTFPRWETGPFSLGVSYRIQITRMVPFASSHDEVAAFVRDARVPHKPFGFDLVVTSLKWYFSN
jgi:hypothetical protein